jgi:hypothetical protein
VAQHFSEEPFVVKDETGEIVAVLAVVAGLAGAVVVVLGLV